MHLFVVCTSDKGLAGAFNTNIVRLARRSAEELKAAGKTVKFYTIGRKGRDQLNRTFRNDMVHGVEPGDLGKIEKLVGTINEARNLGIPVLVPDVNESDRLFTVVYAPKPVPVPRGTCSTLSEKKSRCVSSVVVVGPQDLQGSVFHRKFRNMGL